MREGLIYLHWRYGLTPFSAYGSLFQFKVDIEFIPLKRIIFYSLLVEFFTSNEPVKCPLFKGESITSTPTEIP